METYAGPAVLAGVAGVYYAVNDACLAGIWLVAAIDGG